MPVIKKVKINNLPSKQVWMDFEYMTIHHIRPTSKKVSVAQLLLFRVRLHENLAMLNEEHTISWDVLVGDHVSFLEMLVVQL